MVVLFFVLILAFNGWLQLLMLVDWYLFIFGSCIEFFVSYFLGVLLLLLVLLCRFTTVIITAHEANLLAFVGILMVNLCFCWNLYSPVLAFCFLLVLIFAFLYLIINKLFGDNVIVVTLNNGAYMVIYVHNSMVINSWFLTSLPLWNGDFDVICYDLHLQSEWQIQLWVC